MATIPLPALHVAPLPEQRPIAQPEGPLQMMAQLMSIKNAQQEQQERQVEMQGAQQENQMRQLQLQDQQNLRSAAKGVDWNQPDAFDKFMTGAQASGVSPATLSQLSMQRQQYLKEVADTDTATNQANLANNNVLLGHIETLESIADPRKRAAASAQIGQQILSEGSTKNPQILQTAQAMAAGQLVPSDDQLDSFKAGLLDHKTVLSDALKQAQTKAAQYKIVNGTLYDLSGATPKPALAGQLDPAQWNSVIDTVVPPGKDNSLLNARTKSQVGFYLAQGNMDAAQKVLTDAADQVGAIEKETNPEVLRAREGVAEAEGRARADAYGNIREYPVFDTQTKTTVMMTPNDLNAANQQQPGRFTVPGYSPEALGQRGTTEYFTHGKGAQQITAYNTALKHLDTLDSLATALNNSDVQVFNKAAQTWAEQTGNPAPSNFAAAKNAMSGEVAAALKASGATDQEIANVGQTFNRAQSPAQLRGAIGTYRTLLQSKAQQLQGQYEAGMRGQPNFVGEVAMPPQSVIDGMKEGQFVHGPSGSFQKRNGQLIRVGGGQ